MCVFNYFNQLLITNSKRCSNKFFNHKNQRKRIEIICSDDDDNVLQYDRVEIAILRLTNAMLKRVAS